RSSEPEVSPAFGPRSPGDVPGGDNPHRAGMHDPAADAGTRGAAHDTTDLYRLLVESVRDYAIFALDPTGHILTWNEGAQRFKGYAPHEIIGQHFSVFYPPEDLDKPPRELEIATREGRFEEEGWRVKKDGSRFWANVVITALFDEAGDVVGFAKVTRDLTERRAAQLALTASEERFRLLVQNVEDYGIFMLDPEGRVASWNEGARRISGYEASEIIGRHFSVFYPPEGLAAGKPDHEIVAATREGRFEDEGWRVRKDGSRFWSNVVVTPLRNEAGTLIGFAKVTRDLTARRALEARALEDARRLATEEAARVAAEERTRALSELLARLREQAAELDRQRAAAEAANRAKSDFLTMMSHELRTPLNAIGGYTELLALGIRGPLTPEQAADLDRIARNQQLLLGIINDVLNFSRVEAGKIMYDVGAIPVEELLDEVAQTIGPLAAAKGLALERVPCAANVVARADRVRAEQVLLNLATNAVKFTPAGGRVTLSCAVEAERLAIRVTDTGRGIAAERLNDIFEPFVQVGRTLAQPAEGTGLGLAISRDLARGMAGDVTVQSEPDAGSTFTLWLPRA
ncbi:MAG TPA: PAS domain S-box protein, partial [Gemmatimonadaceae bacterium]|nr:PAS domain S-box protein [Gemmatimonadaceae bacterium]